jgi:hypothetical protein
MMCIKQIGLGIGLALAFSLNSCKTHSSELPPVASFEARDSCRLHGNHSYQVFVPQRKDSLQKLPLLVILDPHGDGKTSIEKFKQGSTSCSVILVASNLIRNNYPDFVNAIRELVEDAKQKYPVGEISYLTGFSGGARMALDYALSHPVSGVIACGALGSIEQIKAIHCPVIAISGTDDFNFIETAQFLIQESEIPSNLKIELTEDSHSWPDRLLLKSAMEYLIYSKPSISFSKSKLTAYCEYQQMRIDSLTKQGNLLLAAAIARNHTSSALFNEVHDFSTNLNAIHSIPAYSVQISHLTQCLQYEYNMRQPLLEAFSNQNRLWWKNEIDTLCQNMQSSDNPLEKDMYQRIKGFIGIACYSVGNQAVRQHDSKTLEKVVFVYHLIEPENPYQWFLASFIPYWQGKEKESVTLLKKAMAKGFTEMDQLKNNMPERIVKQI